LTDRPRYDRPVTEFDDILTELRERKSLPTPHRRREIRRTVGLSQRTLAEAIGTSRSSLARWEAGAAWPRGAELQHYVRLLERLEIEAQTLSKDPITTLDPTGTPGREAVWAHRSRGS
jgi:DNA-binding transcriptional regulator YiaG